MAQVLLNEAYDIEYGIFDHAGSTAEDRLKLVAVHSTEDIYDDTLLDVYTERFVLLGVYEITGVSLDRFWKLSRLEADKLLDLCAARKEKEAAAAESAKNGLEDLIDKHS